MALPLLPKATAVWLVENTALTFQQIADFCGLHELEVQGIADGEVGVGVNVDVTVTDTGLNGRHGRVTDDSVDQSRSPTRDHHIDKPAGLNERGNAGSVGTRDQLRRVGGQAFASECTAQHRDQCRIRCRRR